MPSRSAARPRKSDSTVIELPITPKTDKGTQAPSTATKTTPATKTVAKAVEKPAKPKSKARAVSKEAAEPKEKVAAKPVAEIPAPQIELPKVETAVAEKPPVEKPAKKPVAQPRLSEAPASGEAQQISAEERQRLVAEAAYYIAERRGFATGNEQEDWIAAEAEVEQRLRGSTK